ncbi:MAG: GMP synthase [glutamine-hydrolyzing] [Ignavibacteria bacterium]|nr:GMP synthase [glutamine-hydrolyzing] [Ignavibacteria bacterium]
MKKTDLILILDFGSQYTQLIARRTRELKVYSEIHPYNLKLKSYIKEKSGLYNVKAVILSGGPSSVVSKDSPKISKADLDFLIKSKIPVLGICYGMQLLCHLLKGKLHSSEQRQYGHTKIYVFGDSLLFAGISSQINVWMSHGDSIDSVPEKFKPTSKSINSVICSMESEKQKLYGLQFHPEVHHTESGRSILYNFLFKICNVRNLFEPESFIEAKTEEIKNTVKKNKVLLALSGGVDSSVAAILVHNAIGDNLICIHIDNGLMRKDESRKVLELFKTHFRLNLNFVNASEIFLGKLKGVTDPEKKRKIIGKTFIEVFEKEAKKIKDVKYLVQGTLYPDVIESVSFKGPSSTIKSHHNVGGLPDKMKLKLIEPLRELFKDEVRDIGLKLGIPRNFIFRHPFPGPGLAIRIMSDISRDKLTLLKEVDDIYITELKKFNLYDKIWQAFAVLLPVQTVGVMGDERSYENVIALRAVRSTDGMTADFFHFEKEFLTHISNKIINSVKGVNRVVYDISSKPPATIEWE